MNREIPEYAPLPPHAVYRKYIGGRNSGRRIGLLEDEAILIKRGLSPEEVDFLEDFIIHNTPPIKGLFTELIMN